MRTRFFHYIIAFKIFSFSLDPTVRYTVWSQVIGGLFLWLTVYGINQV